MMDWKSLPAFLAVARTGSLRAGAEQMEGTHATVRRQIEGLEAQLGTTLFRRTAGGLILTPAGRRLLPQAIEAEAALLKGFSAVKGLDREASGRIRLSADPMTAHYVLAPVLADFAALYPEIEIELKLSYFLDSIEKDETDISIRHVLEVEEDAVGRKLFPLSLGVFASRSYIDVELPKAGPKGKGLSWIGYGEVPEMQEMIAATPYAQARIRHIVMDPQMHLHLARAGAGMTLLPNWAPSVFPELQRVPGTRLDQRRSTWILLHGSLQRVRRARLLMDYLSAALLERRADFIGQ
ncbi:LysR family transcriptional regulator [Ponticoccus sp. SC2-23]|uniref:LysR family transcriptional regulator n=1 Tax=Alexandriicola marinus TaxID=2081710 RepID=UPI000FDC2029|nr:LysR family transcriptional regulator [Alexandriicola marinus]MBM1220651.1 LysR family transcriptional regulator [Ponticoccus sp. SC6-9]MBM1225910.1 LysR family transcriptional regulator [Ponticoccus sp. SC6-15]MBM1231207.1 LysR family transcriptional regulator [Ponticoccus sp. SC6-38]MBM1235932.1 LysR family transcriptional regulator [Ponticoccus sp. SC6-45]MBM1240229.1 LysR family transcriptional regulator [Ponticoccus sp. SC6-49]MBM1244764.1 LysR family transcriptional regulator [Pontic